MAKKHAKIPNLTDKTCRLGKIANNLERHGKEWVTGFTVPVVEMMLTKAELNALLRDKYAHQSWFDTSKAGAVEPMSWWNGEEFKLSEEFETDEATITVSGGTELEFQSTGDPKGDDYRAAAQISDVILAPQVGGMTEMRFKLYVLPGIGRTNQKLQEHQHREVKVTWKDARVIDREKRQPELPMGEHGETPAAPESAPAAADAAATH
jgi:hypothetical protein